MRDFSNVEFLNSKYSQRIKCYQMTVDWTIITKIDDLPETISTKLQAQYSRPYDFVWSFLMIYSRQSKKNQFNFSFKKIIHLLLWPYYKHKMNS